MRLNYSEQVNIFQVDFVGERDKSYREGFLCKAKEKVEFLVQSPRGF